MRKLLAIGFIAVLVASGCGTDGGDAPDPYASADAGQGAGLDAGGDCQDNSTAEGPGDLEMQDFRFAPPCLKIDASQGLRLHNEGEAQHNFAVEDFEGLDVDVAPGEENNTEATGLEAGTYTIFCEFHRDSHDMEGELVLVGS